MVHWTAVTQLGTEAADVTWITYGSFHHNECFSASLQMQCMRQNCVRLSSAHAMTFRPWTGVLCAMLHSSIAHSIICTRLFRGKTHSDWFNGIEIIQGRWQHGEKVGYCYPSGLEKTLCKWDIHVSLVTKGLKIH